jgi:hypothetical protein
MRELGPVKETVRRCYEATSVDEPPAEPRSGHFWSDTRDRRPVRLYCRHCAYQECVMETSGYRIDGAGTAVALVNAVTTGGGPSDADLAELLAAHRYLVARLSTAEAERLRDWARRLRPVFDGAEVVALLNRLLGEVSSQPHISDHGLGPHLHCGEPGAGLVDRVRANTAFGLTLVVCEHGDDRLGRCQAGGCDRVYTDVQRGPRRRYCSRACQNRSSVAAFRARRAS